MHKPDKLYHISIYCKALLYVSLCFLILLAQPAYAENSSASYSFKAGQFSNAGNSSQTTSYKVTTSAGAPFASKAQSTNYQLKLGALYQFDLPLKAEIVIAPQVNTDTPTIEITTSNVGAKIDISTVRVLLDGMDVTADCIVTSTGITYTPSGLSDGLHTIEISFKDTAGNLFSTQKTFTVATGTLISARDGGVVVSADGKVKIIIPPGALLEDTWVKVTCPNLATYQNSTPDNYALYVVADCKPNNVIFHKPVQLTFTLDSPQVPGTPVYLGLYKELEGKIEIEEVNSSVAVDNLTASFLINHFSTYAALQNLMPQGAPIGAGVKIPLPDMLTGAFGYSIPITVAPGRKGMQPNIGLAYRSSNSNSWVGLGFSLNPGYIVRSTRLGPPTYNDVQDTFYFITDAGTTELVWLIDNLYQAKIESSFAKFFKEADDSWKIVGKDGSVLLFGKSSESKEGSAQGTFAWYLTKAKDTNGNYIDFNYTKGQGKSYLSRVDYTGNENGTSPTNSVEFFTEARPDIASSYITSSKIATARRLNEIQIKINGNLAWRYLLKYDDSPDTNRSLLKSITQYGSDGKSLPTQNLTYQQAK